MFAGCGAWCLYDLSEPTSVAYMWTPAGSCWERKTAGSCLNHNIEHQAVILHSAGLCPCVPTQPALTAQIVEDLCGGKPQSAPDRSPDTVGCSSGDTKKVRLALANGMFESCRAWCLYDLVE